MLSGKVVFLERLQKMLRGFVFIKVEKDQCPKVFLERHLQLSVSFGLEFRHTIHGINCGLKEFEKT
jgi:hypothetical protein